MIIAIEGMAGAGKTTLFNYIQAKHSDYILVEEFPDEICDQDIDRIISDGIYEGKLTNKNIYFSDIIKLINCLIIKFEVFIMNPNNNQKIIIVDRYKYSTLAYLSVIITLSSNHNRIQIKKILDYILSYLPEPDITIFINIDEKDAYSRLKKLGRTNEKNTLEFRDKILDEYHRVIEKHSKTTLFLNSSTNSTEQLYNEYLKKIKEFL